MNTLFRVRYAVLHKTIGAGLLLVAMTASFAAYAQESDAALQADEIDALEPGVDSGTLARDLTDADVSPDDLDDVDPAVPSAVLAEDVTRSQSAGAVMDRMELGRTEITGNQELPKVLYIVPWKKADPGDLMGKPVNTLLDEVLAPLDREEFVRTVDYYGELNGNRNDD
tara:strand:+ start:1075 stop:1581 length:507 start_codon:yes stop_codon:yes gene_type:complete